MKGSLVIVAFFLAGVCLGYSDVCGIDSLDGDISFMALSALIFCVGIGIGHNITGLMKDLKSLGPRMLLLPFATIAGTLAACVVVSLFLSSRSAGDVLAVGSGFGYYSLSSIFITDYRGAELGTIALIANIIREIMTLLGAPLLCRVFGPLAPISAGGATSMDTALPIIAASSGRQFTVLAVYHGFVVDFSVPFLVTLFCTL